MKLKREDLFRNREYWMVKIQNDLYGAVEGYMKQNNLSRTDLAKKLDVTKGYITQVLKGDFDHKISKMIDLSLAAGKAPVVHFVDLEKYIKDDAEGKGDIYHQDFKPVNYFTVFVDTGRSEYFSPLESIFSKSSVSSKTVTSSNELVVHGK